MLNFETRVGPETGADYPDWPVPAWWQDAKLGFFVHWGIYSVPAWATAESAPEGREYAWHQYAEWYANTLRIPGSPTAGYHEQRFGLGMSYEDLADLWQVPDTAVVNLVSWLASCGGRYVVPTTKHHDGFCLWRTDTTPFCAAKRGPKQDLIEQFAAAARATGMRLGLYFSGALDWHVTNFGPITSDEELFEFRRNDAAFANYAASQLRELIGRFAPDILWNDIDWPDAGKGVGPDSLADIFAAYRAHVPEGVVNDRWGVPYHGHLTREYTDVDSILPEPWEATRGVGLSFGMNENESQVMSGGELIRFFVDVVSKNGNLLLNVGPRADGSLPEEQMEPVTTLGDWLRANGEAVFGTRAWRRFGDGDLRYTASGDEVFVHVLDPTHGVVELPAELRAVRWLAGGEVAASEPGSSVAIPESLRGEPVAVLVCRGGLD